MGKYDDIIDLPGWDPGYNHPRMSRAKRAAQFMPFAALTGYGDMTRETARTTEEKIELDEYEKEELDRKLNVLRNELGNNPQINVTYFVKDPLKPGGSYETYVGIVKRLNLQRGEIMFQDGKIIEAKNVIKLEGEIFSSYDV